jgi:pimeloyl-ACP methyl ester carboxylesterase
MIHGVNGLDVHILEAGYESPGRPLALLLHGFPDLAYGWRHLIPILADAGYHVVAPDQRGFGRTTGWVNGYDTQLEPFSLLNMTRDALGLVSALGYRRTAMLVGHDLGSPVAAYCALARPDVFPSVVLMSAPFPGPPALPFNTAESEASSVQPNTENQKLAAALAALDPPREHYQQYLSTRQANDDMWHPPQGLHAFLRAFFYVKSADWPGNKPHPLKARTAIELAQMPTYYVMDLGKTMPQTVAPFQPSAAEVLACKWLTEPELGVYTEEYGRTGGHRADRRRRSLGPTGAAGSAQHAPARLHQGGRWDGSHQRLGRIRIFTRCGPSTQDTETLAGATMKGEWHMRMTDRPPGEGPDTLTFIPELSGPDQFRSLARRLAKRGHSTARIEKILGLNFLRSDE